MAIYAGLGLALFHYHYLYHVHIDCLVEKGNAEPNTYNIILSATGQSE